MNRNSKILRKSLAVFGLLTLSALILSGCGKKKESAVKPENQSRKEEETTTIPDTTLEEKNSSVPEETILQEQTTEPETTADSVTETHRFQVDYDYLSQFSNEGTNWGQGTTFDEFNRPVYAITAQERNGEYGAYFIMPQEHKLYITMDCGSSSTYMTQILDTLKEKQVKITFFVTMPFVENNPEIILRMVQEGHTIGNHSVTHPAAGMFSLSIDEQINEVKTVHDCLLQKYGYEMDLFRYPQGTYSTQSLALMQQMGYHSVFWSFAYKDYDENDQPEPGYALQKLKDRVHPGAIYLLHVDSKTNADILGEFIEAVRGMGYELGTIR
ncbi:MAG: polysaccharide deacetylase family protein [Lachnospiraceae bacterium]|nr:polysaccharide deacetylase family protein [Lachnospiraceae bacterium]